jgi:hypothetical protein
MFRQASGFFQPPPVDQPGLANRANATDTALSVTASMTVASNNNRILVAALLVNATTDLGSTCSYNGVSMTKIGTQVPFSGNGTAVLFYLLNPPVGTYNLVAHVSSTVYLDLSGLNFYNLAQAAPTASGGQSASSGNIVNTLSIATAPAIHVACWNYNSGTPVGDGVTTTYKYSMYTNPVNWPNTGSNSLTLTGNTGAWNTFGAVFPHS